MDEIDEGIGGSNDSTSSSATNMTDIKSLNRQSVVNDSNITDDILQPKLLKLQNGTANILESGEIDFTHRENNTDEFKATSPTEHCYVNGNPDGDHAETNQIAKLDFKSTEKVEETKSELSDVNKPCKEAESECLNALDSVEAENGTITLEAENKADCVEVENRAEHVEVENGEVSPLDENSTLDKGCLEAESGDTTIQSKPTETTDNLKAPFTIKDGTAQKFKGLRAKFKSINKPKESKDEISPSSSDVTNEDQPKADAEEIQQEADKILNDATGGTTKAEDELLLAGDEDDGIFMTIGSDTDEDLLLNDSSNVEQPEVDQMEEDSEPKPECQSLDITEQTNEKSGNEAKLTKDTDSKSDIETNDKSDNGDKLTKDTDMETNEELVNKNDQVNDDIIDVLENNSSHSVVETIKDGKNEDVSEKSSIDCGEQSVVSDVCDVKSLKDCVTETVSDENSHNQTVSGVTEDKKSTNCCVIDTLSDEKSSPNTCQAETVFDISDEKETISAVSDVKSPNDCVTDTVSGGKSPTINCETETVFDISDEKSTSDCVSETVTHENMDANSSDMDSIDKEAPMEIDSPQDDKINCNDIDTHLDSPVDKDRVVREGSTGSDDVQFISCDMKNDNDLSDKENCIEEKTVTNKEAEQKLTETLVETNDQMEGMNTDKSEEPSSDKKDINDDDDVIFEGETKCEPPKSETEQTPAEPDGSIPAIVESKSVKIPVDTMESSHADSDDDVIFEKEVKPEKIESKQPCDTSDNSVNNDDKSETDKMAACENDKGKSDSAELAVNAMAVSDNESSGRKRPADAESGLTVQQTRKRSKLDLNGVIGKLSAKIETPSIDISDSEEGESCTDTTSMTTDTAPEQGPSEDEKTPQKSSSSSKMIILTEKELDAVVREKVKAYLSSNQDTLISKLSKKVKDLELKNSQWKLQVNDLKVKVNSVTVLQQKLEKRKAATAALRQITTRNVAVQVEDGKSAKPLTANMRRHPKSTVSTPPKSLAHVTAHTPPSAPGGTIRLPIPQSNIKPSLAASMATGAPLVSVGFTTPTVKTLLDTTRVQRTVGSTPLTHSSTTTAPVINVLQYPQSTFIAQTSNPQALLALNPGALTQPSVQTSSVSKSNPKSAVAASPSAKVIDLTDDDDASKTRLVTIPANLTMNHPAVRHVLAPNGMQQAGVPQYQLVFSGPPTAMKTMGVNAPAASFVQSSAGAHSTAQTVLTLAPAQANETAGASLARAAVPLNPAVNTALKSKVITNKSNRHPAPLPPLPANQPSAGLKLLPPKPTLNISRGGQGIILSWDMVTRADIYAVIDSYQLFAYQETSAQPTTSLWKKVGDVKALPLPMACTLTQFQVGHKYHFVVRALDVHSRVGNYSDPESIHLTNIKIGSK